MPVADQRKFINGSGLPPDMMFEAVCLLGAVCALLMLSGFVCLPLCLVSGSSGMKASMLRVAFPRSRRFAGTATSRCTK